METPLDPRHVVIAVFTGDNIVLTRTQSTWDTWIQRALSFGMQVDVLAQHARSTPFPVVGCGGGEANGPGQLTQMWNGYRLLLERHQEARWIFKCDDDSYVNVLSLWNLLSVVLPPMLHAAKYWYIGDCELFCGGGSGLLMNRATLRGLVTLHERGHNCTHPRSVGRRGFAGSDTTTSSCVTQALGGNLFNYEGFYCNISSSIRTKSDDDNDDDKSQEARRCGQTSIRACSARLTMWACRVRVATTVRELLAGRVNNEGRCPLPVGW